MNETMDNNKDNYEKNKENCQLMLGLAEFGANRHNERRSVEFKIFVAYMTLLILAFYQLMQVKSAFIELNLEFKFLGFSLILLAVGIHLVYLMWQVGIGVAMLNDARRRNFYLKKAECILDHLAKYPDEDFNPGDTIIYCNVDNGKNEMTEKELFEKPAPEMVLVKGFRGLFKHIPLLWRDWSRMLVILVPTLSFVILIGLLVKKANW